MTQKQHSLPKLSVQLPYYLENPTIIQPNWENRRKIIDLANVPMSCHVMFCRNLGEFYEVFFSKNHYSFTKGTLNCSSNHYPLVRSRVWAGPKSSSKTFVSFLQDSLQHTPVNLDYLDLEFTSPLVGTFGNQLCFIFFCPGSTIRTESYMGKSGP